MTTSRLLRTKHLVFIPLLLPLIIAVACGAAATSTPAAGPTSVPAATTTTAPGGLTPRPTLLPGATPQPATRSAADLVRESPLALAAGHGEKPRYGGKFLANDWEPIPFYDMHQTSFGGVYVITAPAYNGLLATSPYDPLALEVIPDLARTWELAEGGKKVIFHLAEGVRWHDGAPFTSADARYSIERIKNDPPVPGFVSPRQGVFAALIESVEAPDPNTVVVNGKGPSPLLLPLFANGWNAMVPKHIVEKDPLNALKTNVVGTGAFKLKEPPTTTLWKYERNRDYFEKDLPYLDEIDYHIIQDGQTQLASLLTQRIYFNDVFGGIAWDPELGASAAKREPRLVYQPTASLVTLHLVMNSTKAPTDDRRVRQALSEAIDRAKVADLSPWDGVVGTGNLPVGSWALPKEEREKLIGYGPDMNARRARARELLANYEREKGKIDWGNIKISCATNIVFSCPHAVIIRDMLKEIGVNLETEPMDVTAARGREVSGDYILSALGAGYDFDDPIDTFGQIFITNGGRWYQRQSIPELDALYEKQRFMTNVEERKKAVWEMDKIAMNEAAYLVLFWPNFNHIQWDFVKGNATTPNARTTNARMKYIWLDFPELPNSRR